MSDADRLRLKAQLCLDIARFLSDRIAAKKLHSEASGYLTRAAELDASDIASSTLPRDPRPRDGAANFCQARGRSMAPQHETAQPGNSNRHT
jgi:hypothetical protein